jgi:dTDP-4-amino-4,6-dideoxygalactose transaminase
MGAKAVFADIDLETYNLDPAALERAITPATKAVVAVHLFGLAADMDRILAVTGQRNVRVIEDGACAIGTTYKGRPVGTMGDIGCFSFHPRKAITTGEGGALTTNNDELARRLRTLRNHGTTGLPASDPTASKPWTMSEFDALGFNLRLSDIQAAVGVAQFDKLGTILDHRRARAERYSHLLRENGDIALPPSPTPAREHTCQSYVIRVREGGSERRNRVMQHLAGRGIQTRPGTHAVPGLGYYRRKWGYVLDDYPHAKRAEETTITLPIFPGMTNADQDFVVACLKVALALRGH